MPLSDGIQNRSSKIRYRLVLITDHRVKAQLLGGF